MDLTLERGYARNNVMRNTYWLLALSLVPTILGAYLGISLGFTALVAGSPILSFLLFLVIAFAFIFGIHATKDSALGIVVLLGFTGFMGMVMSPMLNHYLNRSDGVQLIALAAGGTSAIFAGMAFLSTVIKRDISHWGKFLFIGLILLIVAMLANIFLQLTALALTISVIAVGLFSAYLLYDLKQVVDGGETNYITATLSIYLDLINIFQHLLQIFGIMSSNDD